MLTNVGPQKREPDDNTHRGVLYVYHRSSVALYSRGYICENAYD